MIGVDKQTLIAPEHWASYLINGDASGLEAGDVERVSAWLERERVLNVLTIEGEPYYTQRLDLHCPEANALAGSVLDYVCVR